MAFALAAGIGAIGSIASGFFGSSASKEAAQAQAQAAEVAAMVQENAITAQQGEIQQAWNFLAPYRGIGQQAAATLGSMTGVGGNPQTSLLTAPFRPTMAQLAATPGYQFTLQQGQLATQNALSGTQPGGAASKSLVNYAEGLAGTTFQQQFQNYLAQNGVFYTAIRIPEAGKSFRAKRMVSEGRASDQNVVRFEQDSLKAMSDFDAGKLNVNATLDALEAYDRLITPDRPNIRELLRTTLEARPWRSCPCRICKTDGIQVIIFRGNNRNRRRGFHNTYVFYRLLQRALSGERVEFGRAEALAQSQLTLFEQPAEMLHAL